MALLGTQLARGFPRLLTPKITHTWHSQHASRALEDPKVQGCLHLVWYEFGIESGSYEVCPGAWSSVDGLGRKEFRSELIASVGWLPQRRADFPVVWLLIKYPAMRSCLCSNWSEFQACASVASWPSTAQLTACPRQAQMRRY